MEAIIYLPLYCRDYHYISAVNAVKGFLQIPICDPKERKKTAFSTEKGHH
jgi:hypothetical protein